MGDVETIIAYSAGFVGLLSAALVVYVYRTGTALEVRWHKANERMQATVNAFQAVDSNLSEIKEKLDLKASYPQTEKRLADATGKLMVKDRPAHASKAASKAVLTGN